MYVDSLRIPCCVYVYTELAFVSTLIVCEHTCVYIAPLHTFMLCVYVSQALWSVSVAAAWQSHKSNVHADNDKQP